MIKPLGQILSDGSLVDNTIHQARNGVFQVGKHGNGVEIRQGGRGANNPRDVWPLIQQASLLAIDPEDLVLLRPDAEYEHNTGDRFVQMEGFDPLNFTLSTGNLIGSMTADGHTLRVSSRFGDEFLRYIIADADGFIELPERGGMADGSYEWLLIYLWLIKLRKAFRLGLPKTYETRCETLTQVRGRLDPLDYSINHERARYACAYREHSYDNPATRLIARTLEHLDATSKLTSAHSLRQIFQSATAGRRHRLQDLLAAPPLRNPYYADYNPVMAMAKRILRNDLADIGNEDRTCAFFFDVSMLWEYFIRKLLRRAEFEMHDKSSGKWPISSGIPRTSRNLIPDLVFDYEGRTYVFDVKYKNFYFGGPSPGVNRDDLFQLHTYLGQASNRFDVAGCGLIYPVRESEWKDQGLDAVGGVLTSSIAQGRHQIPFHVAFVMIPEIGEIPDDDWPAVFQQRFHASLDSFLHGLFAGLLQTPRPLSTTVRPTRVFAA
jgi:5-methylcytosine-specific restriction enzyme subunit McrC